MSAWKTSWFYTEITLLKLNINYNGRKDFKIKNVDELIHALKISIYSTYLNLTI